MQTPDTLDPHNPPAVLFTTADWLALELMPVHATHESLLSELGLVVLEDLEAYSGVHAANLAVALRRLQRIIEFHGARPVLAQTLCCNPFGMSGAKEYARWLAGGRGAPVADFAVGAPRKELHLYHLVGAPGLRDSHEAEVLPAAMQVAWASACYGGGHHISLAEDVVESDKRKPNWVDTVTSREERPPVLEDPWVDLRDAWVHVREVPVDDFLSLPERVAHGGVCQGGKKDHLVVAVPSLESRGLVGWLMERWLCSLGIKRREPHADVWKQDLRPLGTRLVCGDPGLEMLDKHLLAALGELRGPREQLFDLLPADWPVQRSFDHLREQGLLQEVHRRRLGSDGRIQESRELAVVGRAAAPTPLDTVTGRWVRLVLVDQRSSRDLARVDLDHVFRLAYPGCLLHIDEIRYQVPLKGYADFVERLRAPASGDGGPTVPWLKCEPATVLGFTVPIRERSITRTPGEEPEAYQDHRPKHGQDFATWRLHVDVEERHLGYWLLRDDGQGGLVEPSRHLIPELELEWKLSAVALVIALPQQTVLSTSARVTLRRMLHAALRVLIRLERAVIDIDVVERLGSLAHREEDEGRPAILLIDPYEGGAGLLDALGADFYRFLVAVFQFLWLWSERPPASATFKDIGYEPSRLGDEDQVPDVQAVHDFVARLMGAEVGHKGPTGSGLPTPPASETSGPAPAGVGTKRCIACLQPLTGTFFTSVLNPDRHYCERCRLDREACDFCGVPVDDGALVHRDGRASCTRCSATAVTTQAELNALVEEARRWLEGSLGMELRPRSECPVTLTDAATLAHRQDRVFRPTPAHDPRTAGLFCRRSTSHGDGTQSQDLEILVEDGRPATDTFGTVVHEHVHLWQADHFPSDTDDRWVEGLAVWAQYHAALDRGDTAAARSCEMRDDEVYGAGFRMVRRLEARVGRAGTLAAVSREVGSGAG